MDDAGGVVLPVRGTWPVAWTCAARPASWPYWAAPCSPAAVAPSPVGCGRPASPTSSARPMPCPGRSADARRGWRPWRLCGRCCHGWGPGQSRRPFAPDDTPTKRYGPCVEGAGVHHNPTPGPAGHKFVYGHVWVTLAWWCDTRCGGPSPCRRGRACTCGKRTCRSCRRGTAGPSAPSWRWRRSCCVGWRRGWAAGACRLWLAVDGAYARREVLREARRDKVTVVSRLRKDAALCDLPGPRPAGRRGRPRDLRPAAHRPGQAGRPTPGLADGGVRPVRPERDRVLQDVPGDVAAGRRRHPRGAGAAGQGVGGVLPHRPGGVRGGRADGGGGSGGHRAGVPRPQGGVGRGPAAVAQRVRQCRRRSISTCGCTRRSSYGRGAARRGG